MLARIGPSRIANLLAGVTRNRSMTPAFSSKSVLKPGPIPVANASSDRMPGRKRSSTLPVGRPPDPIRCLSSGVNSARYRIGVENPTITQTGLRSNWVRYRWNSKPTSLAVFTRPPP